MNQMNENIKVFEKKIDFIIKNIRIMISKDQRIFNTIANNDEINKQMIDQLNNHEKDFMMSNHEKDFMMLNNNNDNDYDENFDDEFIENMNM